MNGSNLYYAYNRLRSWNYFAEYRFMRALGSTFDQILRAKKAQTESPSLRGLFLLDKKLSELFRHDAENIATGVYPASVLKPESLVDHARRIPRLIWDGVKFSLRKASNQTKTFGEEAQKRIQKVPDYYRRNFHFQTDGYLSERSAELYEHQVEMLFAGAADAMRRLIIPPLKTHFNGSDGAGLHFLEIAAGTGRSTRFLKLAFPKAQITVTDLSGPYLKIARKRLENFEDLNFVETAGENLLFRDHQFDAVVSIFLFHELPEAIRQRVVDESTRVLKPNGFLGAVDSIQLGDIPEFDPILKNFPLEFHEPFYPNYIQNPLRQLFGQAARTRIGFLSQAVWTRA